MIFCSCGLTSAGTGTVFAGTSNAAGAGLCALASRSAVADNIARQQKARTRSSERGDFFIDRLQFDCGFFRVKRTALYLSAASTLARPALAQASSFSPPGAPDTPMPPIVSLPALIGTPPPIPT